MSRYIDIGAPNPEIDAELADLAVGLDFKNENDRTRFRLWVSKAYYSWKLSAINKRLAEKKRNSHDARYQLATEYLARRKREGKWV